MPISVTGNSTSGTRTPPRRFAARGFTLLELLVVVTIIGIFVGVAVLSIDIAGDDRQSEQEVSRLKSLLDLVREEALLQSRDVGVLFTTSAYRFYYYDYTQLTWLPPADDRLLSEHELASPLELELTVEDRPVVLEDGSDPDLFEKPSPQVMILSTGEITPFQAAVFRDLNGGRITLTADIDGSMEIANSGF